MAKVEMKGPAGLVPVEEKDVRSYQSRGYVVVERAEPDVLLDAPKDGVVKRGRRKKRPLKPEADLDTRLDPDMDD